MVNYCIKWIVLAKYSILHNEDSHNLYSTLPNIGFITAIKSSRRLEDATWKT
jgi:hypothetical protein